MEFNIHYCVSLLFNDLKLTMIVFLLAKNIHFNCGARSLREHSCTLSGRASGAAEVFNDSFALFGRLEYKTDHFSHP